MRPCNVLLSVHTTDKRGVRWRKLNLVTCLERQVAEVTMPILPLVLYCVVAALILVVLTFHEELLNEQKPRSPAGSGPITIEAES